MFKVYAVGQSLANGSNALVVLEATPAVEGCGGGMLISDDLTAILLPAGTYTGHFHGEFTGPNLTQTHIQLDAFDDMDYFSTGQVGVGAVIDVELEFTFSEEGAVTALAGPGLVNGVALTSASYVEIDCGGAHGWIIGRVGFPA